MHNCEKLHNCALEGLCYDMTCPNLMTTGNTGDITLKNTVASNSFSITRSTGDVNFENCDAEEITVQTSTGDVSGTLLTTIHNLRVREKNKKKK